MSKKSKFTKQDLEVIPLLGLCNAEIASRLGISTSAVKATIYRLFDRMGVESRTAAALWSLENKIVPSIEYFKV